MISVPYEFMTQMVHKLHSQSVAHAPRLIKKEGIATQIL